MRKSRGRLARLVTVFLALSVALALTGMGYGIWSDTLSIIGTVETGIWGITLSNFTYSPTATPLSCSASGNVLHVDVDVSEAQASQEYDCVFTISNPGAVPVKIDISPDSPFEPVTGEVTVRVTDTATPEGSLEGAQIEQGAPKDGIVHVYFTTVPSTNFDFDITFNFVPWNQ